MSAPSQPTSRGKMIKDAECRGRPTLHTGAVWVCLSSLRPLSLTPRSRWMANCGIRMIASVRTRRVPAVGQDQAPGQAELAIQPGVQQRAAVDLDAQLLPAIPAGVRSSASA